MKTYCIHNSGPLVNSRLSFVAVGSGFLILRGLLLTKNEQRHETKNCFLFTGTWRRPVSNQIVRSFRQSNSLVYPLLWSHSDHARIDNFDPAVLLLQLMSWFNRMRYPRTQSGRRAYIQNSLKPKYQIKLIYVILILTGIAGLILSLVLCFKGIDYSCSFLIAVISLMVFYLGVQGIERRSEWNPKPSLNFGPGIYPVNGSR
jgi:hypothetical protein